MQIRYCESCGVKLSDLEALAKAQSDLCEKCVSKRAQEDPAQTRVLAQPTSRKSSASRIPAASSQTRVEPAKPSRRTPIGGVPIVATIAPAAAPEIAPPREIPVPPLPPPGQAPPLVAVTEPANTMGFYFCEKCGKRVTDADLAAGRARDKQLRGIFCGTCAEGARTLAFEAVSQSELQQDEKNRRPSERRSTSARLPASKALPGVTLRRSRLRAVVSQSPALLIGGACAVIALVAVAIYLAMHSGESPINESRANQDLAERNPPVFKPRAPITSTTPPSLPPQGNPAAETPVPPLTTETVDAGRVLEVPPAQPTATPPSKALSDKAAPVAVTTQTATPIIQPKQDDTETPGSIAPRKLDLMPLVNPAVDAVAGTWRWADGGLRCYPQNAARLVLPYLPPPEYDFKLVFTEHSGQDAVGSFLSHAGRSFVYVAGGWVNTVSGIETVGGKMADQNVTTRRRPAFFEMGKRHTLITRVRKKGLETLLDDQQVWSGSLNYNDLSGCSWGSLGAGRELQLGVGVWRSCVTFHEIEVTEIGESGRILRQDLLKTESGPADGKALWPVYVLRFAEALEMASPSQARNLIGFARGEPLLNAPASALDLDQALIQHVERFTQAANKELGLLKDERAFALELSDGKALPLGPGKPNRFLGMKDSKAEIEQATSNGKIHALVDASLLSLKSRGELILLARPGDPLGRFGQVMGNVAQFLRGTTRLTAQDLEKDLQEVAAQPEFAQSVVRLKVWLTQGLRERAAKAAFDLIRKPLNVAQQEQVKTVLKNYRCEFADTLFVHQAHAALADLEQQWQSGLRAMYFVGDQTNNFKRFMVLRYEDGLEFNWNDRPPLPAFQADYFGMRMEGLIRVEKAGLHEFLLRADDELSAQIDSTPMMVTKGCSRDTTFKMYLSSGEHTLKIAYREITGQADWRLHWKPPGKGKFEPIPPGVLYYRADAALQVPQQERPLALP